MVLTGGKNRDEKKKMDANKNQQKNQFGWPRLNYKKNWDETGMKDHVFTKTYENSGKSMLEETSA